LRANLYLLEDSIEHLKHCQAARTSPEVAAGLTHVEACLAQSKSYLNDLLTLARTGTVDMEAGKVDAAHVLGEVLYELSELIDDRRIQVRTENPLPKLWCNRKRLKQVFTNLLRNAILHGGDRQEPQIAIFAESDPSAKRAAICIADNGPGIPAESRERIFLPGQRLASANPEGSGMGLAIVEKIVEHYGGRVLVDGNDRWRTIFRVWLPAVADPPIIPRNRRSDRPEGVSGPNRQPISRVPWRISK